MELTADDVLRMSIDTPRDRNGSEDLQRIVLPGIRKVIQPKTSGQGEYLKLIAENDIVVGIGPAGTGKTYLAVAAAVDALSTQAGKADRARAPGRRSRRESRISCRRSCRRRSIHIFARCMTRLRT